MKIYINLLVLFNLLNFSLSSQVRFSQESMLTFGGLKSDGINCLTANEQGIYVTGSFAQNLSLGDNSITANGAHDIYVAKFDSRLNPIWIKRFGSNYSEPMFVSEYGKSITLDSKSNVYVTGLFQNSLTCNNEIVSEGNGDLFLIKLDMNGNSMWAKKISNHQQNIGLSVDVDNNDRVIITGQIQYITNIESEIVDNSLPTTYWIRYNSNGTLDTYKGIKATQGITGIQATTGFDNSIYITGQYTGDLIIDSNTISSTDESKLFIAKYNNAGSFLWVKTYSANVKSIDLNDNGDIIITGNYINRLVTNKNELISKGNNDIFILKLDEDGNEIWAKSIGSTDYDVVNSMKCIDGYILLTGEHRAELKLGNSIVPFNGASSGFIAQINMEGMITGYYSFYSNYGLSSNAIYQNDGVIYAAGEFYNDLISNENTHISKGSNDSWIMKLNIDTPNRIMENTSKSSVKLYPNPCKGFLHCESKSNIDYLKLYALSGTFLKDIKLDTNNIININSLPRGIYLLKCAFENEEETIKIIKE